MRAAILDIYGKFSKFTTPILSLDQITHLANVFRAKNLHYFEMISTLVNQEQYAQHKWTQYSAKLWDHFIKYTFCTLMRIRNNSNFSWWALINFPPPCMATVQIIWPCTSDSGMWTIHSYFKINHLYSFNLLRIHSFNSLWIQSSQHIYSEENWESGLIIWQDNASNQRNSEGKWLFWYSYLWQFYETHFYSITCFGEACHRRGLVFDWICCWKTS